MPEYRRMDRASGFSGQRVLGEHYQGLICSTLTSHYHMVGAAFCCGKVLTGLLTDAVLTKRRVSLARVRDACRCCQTLVNFGNFPRVLCLLRFVAFWCVGLSRPQAMCAECLLAFCPLVLTNHAHALVLQIARLSHALWSQVRGHI